MKSTALKSQDSDQGSLTGTALSTFDIFKGLSQQDRDTIAASLKTRRFDVGSYIISTAQSSTDVFFMLSGQVRVCAFTMNGRQVHFEDLHAGQMFGELAAIDGKERSGDCLAVQPSVLALMSRQHFMDTIDEYPPVRTAVLIRLTTMLRRQMQRVYEFGACSVNQRIRFELLRIASTAETHDAEVTIESPPTHAEIAQRIATHREAVSREISRLQADGIITWRRGTQLVVHDRGTLLQLASANE